MASEQIVFGTRVWGVEVGPRSECAHWHSGRDIVAIRFPCCDEFYACYDCHSEHANHAATLWSTDSIHENAILCGACGSVLTIGEYLEAADACPQCGSGFNPGCGQHRHLYFAG